MRKLVSVGKRTLVVCAPFALWVGCGGGGGAPPVDATGPAVKAKSDDAAMNAAYEKCRTEEDGNDEAKVVRCYQAWIDEYQASGEAGQLRHANRMANTKLEAPSQDAPNPQQTSDGAPKPIVIDEHPPTTPPAGGTPANNPFPPQSVPDGDCWRGAPITGDYAMDYNNLIGRCGKPTGMLPYSHVMEGKFSDAHKADVFTVKLGSGGCYRFFAVAGGSVKDIDIGLATMEGKLVAADKYTQPVAILDFAKPVCVDHDVEFKLIVARDGGGEGGYGFGIWFRPATSGS